MLLSSISAQELPPKLQPAAEAMAPVRVNEKLVLRLQTGEHRANIANESKHMPGRSHPPANTPCLWWERLRPFSTTTECLLTY